MHELQTYFQLLDYGDDMHFEANDSGVISLETNVPELNNDQNLIIQAANRLRDFYQSRLQTHPLETGQLHANQKPVHEQSNNQKPVHKQSVIVQQNDQGADPLGCHSQHVHTETGTYHSRQFGAHIRVEKRIPVGGGLGGGSSNAATTLLALNQLWHLGLSMGELTQIGQELGADVPIFVRGQSAWAEGTGELITPLSAKPMSQWYLVLCPDCRVSTKKIFNNKGLTRNRPKCKISLAFADGSQQLDFSQRFTNDCEAVTKALYPEVQKSCELLAKEQKAAFTRMSGTGACVFGAFVSEDSAKNALAKLPNGIKAFVAKGINCQKH